MKATVINTFRLERLGRQSMSDVWTGTYDSLPSRPADLDDGDAAARGFVNAVVLGLVVWHLLALAAWLLA